MRISSNQFNFAAINAILDQQTKVSKTQIQIATGKRVVNPSDDPGAASRILEIEQSESKTDQYQSNADAARTRLTLEEGALADVTLNLQKIRELALQAGNTILSNNDRKAIASELKQNLDALLASANTVDNNGDFLFAGFQGKTQPFAPNAAGTFDYFGDDGQRQLQISESRQIADSNSGTEVFRSIRNGNGTFVINEGVNTGTAVISAGTTAGPFVPDTYTIAFTEVTPDNFTYTVTDSAATVVAGPLTYQEDAIIDLSAFGIQTSVSGTPADGDSFVVGPSTNQDMFQTVQNLVNSLEAGFAGGTEQAQYLNQLNRSIVEIDNALENTTNIRSSVGARLNAIDIQLENNESFKLSAQETLSNLQDLDYAEAASRLNLQLLGLQAAQQSFVRIQNLSLFNFL